MFCGFPDLVLSSLSFPSEHYCCLMWWGAVNPPMVKPFRLTHLAGEGGLVPPPLEILMIACLTFCLLLTDRPTLGLPEYKLKVVNICEMDGCRIVRKSDEKVL